MVLTPDLNASSVDGWDGLSQIRLMVTIEEALGIRFDTAEIGSQKNVGELVSLIERKLT